MRDVVGITEVEVVAVFVLGTVIPLSVIWRDGRMFDVEDIVCCGWDEKYPLKGRRYTVRMRGEDRDIWLYRGHWYVRELKPGKKSEWVP